MSIIPTWVWIIAAVLLGVLSVGSIGVFAKRRTILDAARMLF